MNKLFFTLTLFGLCLLIAGCMGNSGGTSIATNSGKGNLDVKKVNFGDPNMRIKKSNPKRRKSFRARHNCDNPGPKTKARYWSCRKWEE